MQQQQCSSSRYSAARSSYSAGRLNGWWHGPTAAVCRYSAVPRATVLAASSDGGMAHHTQLRSVAGMDFSCQGLAAWQNGGGAGRLTSWRQVPRVALRASRHDEVVYFSNLNKRWSFLPF